MAYALLCRISELAEKLLRVPPEPPHHDLLRQVQEDLQALQRMVRRIQAVLNDAEKMEIHNESVKLWLAELKSVAYDAEDVLDEYGYEVLRAEVEAVGADAYLPCERGHPKEVSKPTTTSSMPWVATFWGKVAGRIRMIRSRFEEITSQRDALHLRVEDGDQRRLKIADRPPSSHIVDAPNIYGRKGDAEKILSQLLSSAGCKKNNLLVLPIVGMGGVGKTTLAQHVYNHEKVSDRFQLKGWVCVSDDFTVDKLTIRIIESLTRRGCQVSEFSALQEQLVQELEGKRFLLVLDDVWNENPSLWESLQKPLRFGVQGSAVLTTTRSEAVARIMQTVPFHRLDCLSVDDCWTVFKETAFSDQDPDDNQDHLMELGKMIVGKCGGLPLAAKSLGGLLKYENEVDKWEEVLQNNIWDVSDDHGDGIMPVLRLSYLHLPSYLKPCFLYTSTYPKDSRITKNVLILQWVAQGFIQCKGCRQAEDIGDAYFNELVQRSFFQCHPQYLNRKDPDFVMHDLVHDLAKHISGEEFFHMGMEGHVPRLNEVRHLSLIDHRVRCLAKMLQYSPSYCAPRTIRTLVVQTTRSFHFEMRFLQQMIPQLELLRVLDLSGSSIWELPDSIGNLKFLRYLNLEYTRIKKLPDSICKLYYLQALSLMNCLNLISLPKDVKNLHNLRFLEIGGTKLYFLPRGIGKMRSLRALDKLIVGRRWPILNKYFPWTEEDYNDLLLQLSNVECSGIEELKDLLHLRGRLLISDLQSVLNPEDARLADLRNKRNIKELVLNWVEEHLYAFPAVPASPDVQMQVLENLRPSDHLEVLEIHHYGGPRFPIWRADNQSSFSKLIRVKLYRCGQCASLPPLGRLPSLKHLEIEGMAMVRAVGPEFYGHPSVGFPALEELIFSYMDRWVAWDLAPESGHFCKLSLLVVSHCPMLESMAPLYLLPALKELHIWRCPKLLSIELQWRAPSSPSSLFMGLPPLTKMMIQECPQARFLPEDDEHLLLPSTLRDLTIDCDCPFLVEWCEKGGESRLAQVPNAKVWSVRNGKKMVSTSAAEREKRGVMLKFSSFFMKHEVFAWP